MGGDNTTVGLIAALLMFLGLAWNIGAKSSASIAFSATLLLAIAGIGLIVVMLIAYLVFGKKSNEDVKTTQIIPPQ